MPKISIEVKQSKNAPVKSLTKDGIKEMRKMVFTATHNEISFTMTVTGSKKGVHNMFGVWPLEFNVS